MPVLDVAMCANEVVFKLKERPDRSIYESADGDFFIDYGGGRVAPSALKEAYKAKLIKLKWSDRPDIHCYVLT